MRHDPNVVLNYKYKEDCGDTIIGSGAIIRSGTIIYGDVVAGTHLQTGHNVLIRENTAIGNHVVVGTNVVIDGTVDIGDFVKIETGSYICTHVVIGCRVFIGPNVTMTNDKLPLKDRNNYKPAGPVLGDGVTIGAGAILLPGVKIGKGSFVAAGAIVAKDVPSNSFVIGSSADVKELPEKLKEGNMAISWKRYINP